MELEALLLAFVSTHGTYLVVQYEGITLSGRGESAVLIFFDFLIKFYRGCVVLGPVGKFI